MITTNKVLFSVLTNPDTSLKRIAWVYGVAKKGSPEEAELRRLLIERAAKESADA